MSLVTSPLSLHEELVPRNEESLGTPQHRHSVGQKGAELTPMKIHVRAKAASPCSNTMQSRASSVRERAA